MKVDVIRDLEVLSSSRGCIRCAVLVLSFVGLWRAWG